LDDILEVGYFLIKMSVVVDKAVPVILEADIFFIEKVTVVQG